MSNLPGRLLLVALGATLFARATPAAAQTPIEFSSEARFQLDVHVPDAALAAMLPPGFTPNVATQGNAKDANLRVIFTDRMTINGPDGKPIGKGSSRLVYLAAPVKDAAGNAVQVVIGGLVDSPADAPGPFGVYLPATSSKMVRSTTSAGSGPVLDTQDWLFEAATGEHLELHIKYDHEVGNKGNPSEGRFYSAKTPSMFQVWKQEQVLFVLRNATTNPPDHVKEFTFTARGGSYAKIFDGTQKSLSWDNIIWVNRTISQ
jgi:hypothetical protein